MNVNTDFDLEAVLPAT